MFLPILLFILVTAILNTRTLTSTVWLLVGEFLFGGVGFLWLYLFFRYKNDLRARFGPLAYSKAVSRFGYPGVAIIATVVTRIRTLPGPQISRGWWSIALPTLGWTLIAGGLLLFLRTLQIFGVDNLTMLYVYFPGESRLVENRIYKVLRHPAYAAAQRIAFGLALLNGNWFALACALFFALALWAWVRLVEENELIERFGQPYTEYRQGVPAFWPRPRDLRRFFEFLIFG
ncbi:MAG TPA: methyltransferase [Candidatus Binatia bacterium]|nr:methyltransferase [Candidatus Binatia bacterium]